MPEWLEFGQQQSPSDRPAFPLLAGPVVLYATGRPSMVDVLDLDDRHGGADTFAKIRDRLPRTPIFRTGGDGGYHIQFLHHPSMRLIPQGGMKGLPGAEVKSTDGYAIAWWACRDVKILDNYPLAPWPDWLLKLAERPPPPPIPPRSERRFHGSPSYRLKRVVETIENGRDGSRHGLILWGGIVVGNMWAEGAIDDLDGAIEEVVAAGMRTNKPEKECRRTARDGVGIGRRRVGG